MLSGLQRSTRRLHLPAVLIAAKQILATHYLQGALGLTMVLADSASGTSYLVYLSRSQLDLLKGPLDQSPGPLPLERSEFPELPRLIIPFNRSSYARLRRLIDYINDL